MIEERLYGLKEGEIVALNGLLVSVEMPGFFPWTSSLSLDDGRCEIMWIETVNH